MSYKKIRGYKRKLSGIQNWVKEYAAIDIEQLQESKYHYSKVYVHPWDSFTLTNSQIPEPKGEAKRLIIKGLETIYDSWKIQLDKLQESYYLKIWIYESRVSRSQVVCAIGERIVHYNTLFQKIDNKKHNPQSTTSLSSEFYWHEHLDEEPIWESDLKNSIGQYKRIKEYYSDKKLLNRLKKGQYRTQIEDNPNGTRDRIYFLPKGKIWIGGK